MTTEAFLTALRVKLSGLPKKDIEDRLAFYAESIADRMEEGKSEEEAIADIGSVDEIAKQIVSEIPLLKIAKERIKPKQKLASWQKWTIGLSSVVWGPLLISLVATLFSLYVSLFAVVVSLWAGFASLVGGAVGGLLAGIVFTISGNIIPGLAMLAAAAVCMGMAIYFFFLCKYCTKAIVWLLKIMMLGIKNTLLHRRNRDA